MTEDTVIETKGIVIDVSTMSAEEFLEYVEHHMNDSETPRTDPSIADVPREPDKRILFYMEGKDEVVNSANIADTK
jgi:hypothetical protein